MSDLHKLKFVPLVAGYSGEIDSGVISQQLDGGAPRFRRVSKNNVGSISCAFKLDEAGYQYMMAFYRVWCRVPSCPFFVEMFLDDPEIKLYECWFVPNSVKLTSKNGLIYNISAQLIVKNQRIDPNADDVLIAILTENDSAEALLNPLEKIANIDMPENLGG